MHVATTQTLIGCFFIGIACLLDAGFGTKSVQFIQFFT